MWHHVLDLFLLLIIFWSARLGWRQGFLAGILELGGWLGSLLAVFWLYPYTTRFLGHYFPATGPWTLPLSFLLTLILVRFIVSVLVDGVIRTIPKEVHVHQANHLLGIIPGLLNGFIGAALLATLITIVPLWDKLSAASRDSRVASLLTARLLVLEEKLTPSLDATLHTSLSGMIVEPGTSAIVPLPYRVLAPQPRPELEGRMRELLNRERRKKGLRPLRWDPELTEVARAHSRDMFRRGYFAHMTPEGRNPFDRMRSAKVRFLIAGENLALAQTLLMAHEGLMHSPGHRANILQPSFGRVGIGILDGGRYGLMVTQNFRN